VGKTSTVSHEKGKKILDREGKRRQKRWVRRTGSDTTCKGFSYEESENGNKMRIIVTEY
jgi:hypothetical protein